MLLDAGEVGARSLEVFDRVDLVPPVAGDVDCVNRRAFSDLIDRAQIPRAERGLPADRGFERRDETLSPALLEADEADRLGIGFVRRDRG